MEKMNKVSLVIVPIETWVINFSRVWTVERSWGVDPLRCTSVRERTGSGDHVMRKPREIGAILRDVVNWIKSWWRGNYPWSRRTGTLYSMDWIYSFHPSTEWRVRYMRNHVQIDNNYLNRNFCMIEGNDNQGLP